VNRLESAARLRKSYDYVVIGSGSAGCVVAARLAEDGHHVLLLEAGPWDDSIFIRMPAALGIPLGNDTHNWCFQSEPEPYLNNRRILEARGRVLGGSSSINGMNWVRGNPLDYDRWGSNSAPGWSYAEVLPYFKKAESFSGVESAYRGRSGPMRVETCAAAHPMYQRFLAAGEQAGLFRVADHNAFRQEGVHVTQRNVGRGLRWSTSRGYLHEGPAKPSLDVMVRARVSRVEIAGKRAVRVHLSQDGKASSVEVDREVALCAGALSSPQLLLLSGVGDKRELAKLGIKSTADLPGVGRGLKDHTAAAIQYTIRRTVSVARELSLIGRALLGAQWLLTKKGLGATNFFEVGAFIRTRDSEEIPNIQFEFLPMLGELQHGAVKLSHGFQYYISLMRPRSSGRVWIDSADPSAAPRFVFNYLQDPDDCRQLVEGVAATRRIIAQPAWEDLRGEEVTPGPAVKTDDEILAWLRANASTNYHPCCSARMGQDDLAVTDEHGIVHALDNLRVVDASIMPEIVSGNLNAPVIMMAEKIADHIRGRPPLAPEAHPFYRP
jgi:choline dehydrogenase